MISINDLYWVAGFLEGEGAFMVHNHRRPYTKVTYPYWMPIVDAVQVNQEPILRLKNIFGGGIVRLVKPSGNCSQAYAWRLHGRKAIALMMTLWPLMSQKRRDQIELAVARWKSNPGLNSEVYRQSRPRGESNGNSKLNEACVRDILTSSESTKTLADKYGVSRLSILNVRHRKTWEHVSYNRVVA